MVSVSLQEEILQHFNAVAMESHFGLEKTVTKIKKRFCLEYRMMSQTGVTPIQHFYKHDSSSEELCSFPNRQVWLSNAGSGSGHHGSPTGEPLCKQLCICCMRLFQKIDLGIC